MIFSEEIQVSSISIVRIQIFQDLPGFFRLFLRQIFIKVRTEIINTVRRIISAHHFLRGFYMLRVHLADFSKLSGVGDPLSHVGIRLSQLSVIVPVFKGICLGFVYKSNQMLFLILSALIREDLVHDSRQHCLKRSGFLCGIKIFPLIFSAVKRLVIGICHSIAAPLGSHKKSQHPAGYVRRIPAASSSRHISGNHSVAVYHIYRAFPVSDQGIHKIVVIGVARAEINGILDQNTLKQIKGGLSAAVVFTESLVKRIVHNPCGFQCIGSHPGDLFKPADIVFFFRFEFRRSVFRYAGGDFNALYLKDITGSIQNPALFCCKIRFYRRVRVKVNIKTV